MGKAMKDGLNDDLAPFSYGLAIELMGQSQTPGTQPAFNLLADPLIIMLDTRLAWAIVVSL